MLLLYQVSPLVYFLMVIMLFFMICLLNFSVSSLRMMNVKNIVEKGLKK
nr:ATP synthase F0 subunit 8 [Aonchotheca putorii]WBV76986.1 ATP synthase F0 subunit 8 [Aonchotheca putorii]